MKQQRLMVEGNDFHVVLQICVKHGLKRPKGFLDQKDFERNFIVRNSKGEPLGKNALLAEIPKIAKSADMQAFGLVVDADKSSTSTWQSVKDALKNVGYANLPSSLDVNGAIITDPYLPKVGVWIMPDNQNSGEIEDFFLQLIDGEDFRLKRARKVVGELIVEKPDFHLDANHSKAETHTWLAWQEEPGKSMGLAIKSNWVNAEHPLAARFADWFAKLFELED